MYHRTVTSSRCGKPSAHFGDFTEVPCGILITDAEGSIFSCNRYLAEILGFGVDELISKYLWDISPPETRLFLQTHIWPTVLRELSVSEIHVKLTTKSGEHVPVMLNVHEVNREGNIYYCWAIFVAKQRNELEKSLLNMRAIAELAADDLKASSTELIRSNEALSNFAYLASHDLKAPLVNIAILAECIQDDLEVEPSQEIKDYFALINGQISRMQRLICDLHEYSKVGSSHGDFKALNFSEFVGQAFDLVKPLSGFRLEVIEKIKNELRTLNVPFEVVLRNLINNAVKHHDKKTGVIQVSITENDTNYTIDVIDDGPGIPPELHQKAFEMFKKVHTRNEIEGSGIGLSLVKRTVDQYGGEISIHLVQPRGSRFSFSWPKEDSLRVLTSMSHDR